MPELGERGHIIVTVLRRMGYLDRERDVEQGGIKIEQEELAALCGFKLRTLQREFGDEGGKPVNPALHLFVQREKQYHRNRAGCIMREKTVYVVQMNDPVHQNDLNTLQEEVEHKEKGRTRQIGGPPRQFGGNNKESITLDTLETLDTPSAVGDSQTLFPEQIAPAWAQLTDAEQQPY